MTTTAQKVPFLAAQNVKDVNKAFLTMRNVALAAIACVLVVSLAFGVLLYQAYQSSNQKVYVASDNGTFSAVATTSSHTSFEARNLVLTFMEKMFEHDQYSFRAKLNAGLPLIEERGGRFLFESFERGQVLQNYVRYGARQTITVDSVKLKMNARPITGEVYIKQIVFIGDQRSQSKPLAAKFALVDTDRSDRNPFGLLITDFDFIPYNPGISQQERDLLRDQEAARQRKLREQAEAAGVPLPQDSGPAPAPSPNR